MSHMITLRDLIDVLIDLEQAGDGELANQDIPVIAAWPEVAMIRIKTAQQLTHTSKIPLFGIEKGQRYIQLKLA